MLFGVDVKRHRYHKIPRVHYMDNFGNIYNIEYHLMVLYIEVRELIVHDPTPSVSLP